MTATSNTEAGIRVEGLTAAYDRQPVLDEIDVNVSAGEMVGIIGPNGSGKSTLLKVIGRLLSPERGAVYLNGESLSDLSTVQITRRMATLPQAPPTPPELTARELVGYGRYPHVSWLKRFANQDKDIIDRTISACNLDDLADRKLSTLSGGERQKAWIAMAMAQQPSVMLLDEPVTFLDISHQLEVMDLVADLNRSEGITVIAALQGVRRPTRVRASAHQDTRLGYNVSKLPRSCTIQSQLPGRVHAIRQTSGRNQPADQQRAFLGAPLSLHVGILRVARPQRIRALDEAPVRGRDRTRN